MNLRESFDFSYGAYMQALDQDCGPGEVADIPLQDQMALEETEIAEEYGAVYMGETEWGDRCLDP
jgi:hypothetical protein